MLKQIIKDMYIDPDLLQELDEEQKQLLFCKMREEQVRRWKSRVEKEEEQQTARPKKPGAKKVSFQMGFDGEPVVVVIGDKDDEEEYDAFHQIKLNFEHTVLEHDEQPQVVKSPIEEELDRFVSLSRETVEAMEEEASRNAKQKKKELGLQGTPVRSTSQPTPHLENGELSKVEAESAMSTLSLTNDSDITVFTESLLETPSPKKFTVNSSIAEALTPLSLSTVPHSSAVLSNTHYTNNHHTSCSTFTQSSTPMFYTSTFSERIRDRGKQDDKPLTLSSVANTIAVADKIKRWEQLRSTPISDTPKKSKDEIQGKALLQSANTSVNQEMDKNESAWLEQERKAKAAEKSIREIARRAREEHRRSSLGSPPVHAINRNLSSFTPLRNGFDPSSESDINGNVGSGFEDISNNNSCSNEVEYGISGSRLFMGGPNQKLRPPKPPSRASIISWFQEDQLPRGAGLDVSRKHITPWFHGVISRTEAEKVLEGSKIGSYLVRVSERIWGYTISYRASDRCRHYLIDVTGGRYTFFGSHQAVHETLGDLIEYHGMEPITSAGQELLLYPCGQDHPHDPDYKELFEGTQYMIP